MEGSRKRKLPARATRQSEAPSKRRISTPPEPRAQPTPPPQPEDTLPTSIVASKPLPTVDEPQPDNLSNTEYQTISESGVLVESLQRSRQKWISRGIFEKYYTKPTAKNKATLEADGNPGKDTMTKLGTCSITIEPHIFDATMYGIKEPKQPPLPSPVQQPQYRPIIQYGPPNGVVPPPQPHPAPQTQSAAQALPTPNGTTATNSPASTSGGGNTADTVNGATTNGHTNGTTNPPARQPDPVIQMLAEKAATDADLKDLMRIVANGEASSAELKRFQLHIDELGRVLKSRQNSTQPSTPSSQPPPPPPSSTALPPTQPNGISTPTPKPTVPPASSPQPQALRSKGPLPPSKPEFSGICLEFASGNGDRYLFPRFSILEYLPGGQVLASFLIVRKGSSSTPTTTDTTTTSITYDPKLDYYQPVTIRLYTHQGRQLEVLQRTVAPAEETRRYMDAVMDEATRAEYVLLAMRLPREGGKEKEKETREGETEEGMDKDDTMLWLPQRGRSLSMGVGREKQVERLVSEEEKYQSFVRSVAAS